MNYSTQNEHIANIQSLADGSGIGDGAIDTSTLANSAVTAEKLALIVASDVGSTNSTTSTSYVATDAAVTVPISASGKALAIVSAFKLTNSSGSALTLASIGVTGATTVNASDTKSLSVLTSTGNLPQLGASRVRIFEGLNQGNNTFTVMVRVSGGTAYVEEPTIQVLAL